MKILIMDQFGNTKEMETTILPRVGDSVDLFYKPYPKVSSVLLFPTQQTLVGISNSALDAIITVI